jgi:hypothetical protein
MAQSATERLTALERIVDAQTTRLDLLFREADALDASLSEAAKDLVAWKRDSDREIALLKREVEELKKWQDEARKGREEWGRQLWMIVPPILAVLISAALTLVITLTVKK